MRKSIVRYGLALWLACGVAAAPYFALAEDNKEYLVKAAFIYNFVKFVEWPSARAISNQSKIDICVLGDSPLNSATDVFKAASTSKLALSLVEDDNLKSIGEHCYIVFISHSEADHLNEILASFKGKPVLTVSDIDGFAEKGGMIGFVTSDNKVKITVNTKAVAASGMRVDAQLLEIALKVIDK